MLLCSFLTDSNQSHHSTHADNIVASAMHDFANVDDEITHGIFELVVIEHVSI